MHSSRPLILVVGDKTWPSSDDVITVDLNEIDTVGIRASAGKLQVHDKEGNWSQVSGVIWRYQFDTDFKKEHSLLSMIRLAGTPCLNSAHSLLSYGSRIDGNAAMLKNGLPVIKSEIFLGAAGIGYFYQPSLPEVIKVGHWQSGYGKIRVQTQDVWLDAVDMTGAMNDHVSVEPYIDYVRDLRCLSVFGRLMAMERIGSQWKANVCPKEVNIVDVPAAIGEATRKAARALEADIVGVDWIQSKNGEWIILEANLSPALASTDDLFDLRKDVTNQFRSNISRAEK